MPDNPTDGQGSTVNPVQSQDPSFFISPLAQWYMGLKAEAQPGQAPAALDGGGGDQGGEGGNVQPDGGGGGFNWDLFPDVPEAQRSLLEPHLKNVQGHVTKLEQQYAPYKFLLESGVDADAIKNLIAFDQQFSQNPTGIFLNLAENLQKEGKLPSDLDLAVLKAIVNGEPLPGEGEEEPVEGGGGEEDIPTWGQQLMEMVKSMQADRETEKQQSAEQERSQKLDKALGDITGQLKEAGYAEESIPSKEILTGMLIAHQGQVDKVISDLTGLRENVLKGLKNGQRSESENEDNGPNIPNGVPKPQKTSIKGRHSEFDDARKGAAQMLESKLRAEAQ